MDLTITQSNLYLLLPGKLSWMAEMYANDHNLSISEALRRLYESRLYRALEQENTKLWHDGPVALYQDFLSEQENQPA